MFGFHSLCFARKLHRPAMLDFTYKICQVGLCASPRCSAALQCLLRPLCSRRGSEICNCIRQGIQFLCFEEDSGLKSDKAPRS